MYDEQGIGWERMDDAVFLVNVVIINHL